DSPLAYLEMADGDPNSSPARSGPPDGWAHACEPRDGVSLIVNGLRTRMHLPSLYSTSPPPVSGQGNVPRACPFWEAGCRASDVSLQSSSPSSTLIFSASTPFAWAMPSTSTFCPTLRSARVSGLSWSPRIRVWPFVKTFRPATTRVPAPGLMDWIAPVNSTLPEGTPVITNLPAPSVMLLRLVPVTLTRIPLAPDIAWGTPDAAAVG